MGVPRPAPVPENAGPPSVPVLSVWRPSFPATPSRYRVRVETRLARDSAGRKEEAPLTTSGQVEMTWPGGRGGRVEGRVSAFLLSGSERVLDPAVRPAARTVAFEGTVDSLTLRLSVVPALSNECDAPETAALAMARELFVRWPASLAVGTAWRDSSATFSCRGGLPIVTRVRARFVVREATDPDLLDVVRSSEVELSGELKQAFRAVRLRGRGTGESHFLVSRRTGMVVTLDGTSSVELVVTDASRGGELRVMQTTVVHAEREP
jgi:hypothetical protein